MISTRFAFVISCVIFLLMAIFTGSMWWSIPVALATLYLLVSVGWLAERWGKIGRIWAICPFNKMLFEELYGNVIRVIARPSSDSLARFTAWKLAKESGKPVTYDYTDEKGKIIHVTVETEKAPYKIVVVGKSGLVFLGWWWKHKIREFPWSAYEPPENARHSIFLGDYTITWGSQHPGVGPDSRTPNSPGFDEHGWPDLFTADPICVASSAMAIVRAVEYEKFGYKLHFPKDVLRDLILGVWREQVLAKHKFFSEALLSKMSGENDIAKIDVSEFLGQYQPEILQLAQKHLNVALGIAQWTLKEKDDQGQDKAEWDTNGPIEYIQDPAQYEVDSVGYQVYHDYGMMIVRVVITDLEEVGAPGKEGVKTIRETMEDLLKITVERRKDIIKADGERQAAVIRADGNKRAFAAEISAFETEQRKDGEKPSLKAVEAYLDRKALDTLSTLPKDGRVVFFGTPGERMISRILGQAGVDLEVGRKAFSSEKEEGGGTKEKKA